MQTQNTVQTRLRTMIAEMETDLVELRRALHANPELSHGEANTSVTIGQFLRKAGLDITTGVGGHGIICEVGPVTSAVVGFRCDMDALPVSESTGLTFASRNSGIMHACGHDAHSAILAGLARMLKQLEDALPVRTRLIFQPAEESADSGALKMIDAGAAGGLSALFGIHVDPGIDLGRFGIRNGAMMASVDFVEIEVSGKGGHGAYPEQTIDPIRTATVLLNSLYDTPREFGSEVILSFGQIAGGTNHNVIPDTCLLKGTFRTFDPSVRQKFSRRLAEIAGEVQKRTKATIVLRQIADAPPVLNDPTLGHIVEKAIADEFGDDARLHVDPMKASEDFAYYGSRCPVYFLRLGTASGETTRFPLHSTRFDIDERVLPLAVRLLTRIALQFKQTDQPGN